MPDRSPSSTGVGGAPLAGLVVIELTGGRAEMCARVLSDLGADVTLVEPPGGSPSRSRSPVAGGASLYFETRNAGKRSVTVDMRTPEGRDAIVELIARADIFIESLGAGSLELLGLAPPALLQRFPQLVIASISDFGQTGPYSSYRASEATLTALGGVLSRSGLPGRPPVIPPGQLATESSAVQAAWCVLLAYWNRLHTGAGDYLDFSLHEATAQVFDPALGVTGSAAAGKSGLTLPHGRPDEGFRYPIFPCADGHVRLCVLSPRQWHALRAWLGEPDVLQDPSFDLTLARFAASDVIFPLVRQHFLPRAADDLVAEGQHRGIPIEKLAQPGQVLDDPHFRARGAFAPLTVPDGRTGQTPSGFFEIDGVRVGATGPAPAPSTIAAPSGSRALPVLAERAGDGSNGHARRPLEGLKVLDLGVIVAGAELGRIFADQGADVVKVENRAFPDGSRQAASGTSMSPSFASGHRGKRSAGINLKDEVGRQLFLRLVAEADLVFSNFKPGTLEKLGLGYDVLAGVNPQIVAVDSSALGSTGPRSRSMGYGPLVRAATSLTTLWKDPSLADGFCDAVTIFPDHFVARVAGVAALSLVIRRESSGQGGHASISQAEAILMSLSEYFLAESLEPGHLSKSLSVDESEIQTDLVLSCAGDDEWCVVTLNGHQDWLTLAKALDRWSDHAREAVTTDRLERAVREWAKSLPPTEVMEKLQFAGVAAGAMVRPTQYVSDPQLASRSFIQTLVQPGLDEALPTEGSPVRSLGMLPPKLVGAPLMCEHTRQVVRDWIDLSDIEIDQFISSGALEINKELEATHDLLLETP